jgi:hypothetical protein
MSATAAPAATAARGWRDIARGVKAFLTDGVRYAAWQRPGSPITVLDTFTGRTRELAPQCEPVDADRGRLLLDCERQQALIDIRSGSVTQLPSLGELSAWSALGLDYVGGKAASGTHCGERPTHDECLALYDIATGAVVSVPKLRISDLDRPGAPPLCQADRERLLALAHGEGFEAFDYIGGYERGSWRRRSRWANSHSPASGSTAAMAPRPSSTRARHQRASN